MRTGSDIQTLRILLLLLLLLLQNSTSSV